MNLSSPKFLKKAANISPLTFSMENLLHRLYGVDAPGGLQKSMCLYLLRIWVPLHPVSSQDLDVVTGLKVLSGNSGLG